MISRITDAVRTVMNYLKTVLKKVEPSRAIDHSRKAIAVLLTLTPVLSPFLFPSTLRFAGSLWHLYIIGIFILWQLVVVQINQRAAFKDIAKPDKGSKPSLLMVVPAVVFCLILLATVRDVVEDWTFYLIFATLTFFPLYVSLENKGRALLAFCCLFIFFLGSAFIALSLHFGSWAWQTFAISLSIASITAAPSMDSLLLSISDKIPQSTPAKRTRKERKQTRKVHGELPIKKVCFLFNLNIIAPPAIILLMTAYHQLPQAYLLAAALFPIAILPLQKAKQFREGAHLGDFFKTSGALYGLATLSLLVLLRLLSW